MATIFGSSYHDDGTWQIIGWTPLGFPVLWEFGSLVGQDEHDIIKGYQGNDHLHGNGGNDNLFGGADHDLLTGGLGNDLLHGGTGNDTMRAGIGNDTYVVMDADDQVIENIGEGTDTVRAHINYTLTANVDNLVLQEAVFYAEYGDNSTTFVAPSRGTGNALDNRIEGNSRGNTLSGIDGNDTIWGQGGADFIQGGTGNDVLFGGDGGDWLDGGDDNDWLYGDADNDILLGGNGYDFLNGGTGSDTMIGGAGNDSYTVDHINDIVRESPDSGIDSVFASVSYTLTDNVENLNLSGSENISGTGNSGNNQIYGNRGDNNLVGGTGNDTLSGYEWATSEYDTLTGGAGSDTFVLGDSEGSHYTGSDYAIIKDFDANASSIFPLFLDFEYDTIQVSGSLSDYTLSQQSWAGVGSVALDTVIYKGTDVIGIVQDTTNVSLNRNFLVVS